MAVGLTLLTLSPSHATASAHVAMPLTVASDAIVASWAFELKAAHPSLSTTVLRSSTCAARTVEATPPLVTMPATMSELIPSRLRTNSRRLA